MLTLKILWGFTKNIQNNHILPELMMWLYSQIVHYDLEKITSKLFKLDHDDRWEC